MCQKSLYRSFTRDFRITTCAIEKYITSLTISISNFSCDINLFVLTTHLFGREKPHTGVFNRSRDTVGVKIKFPLGIPSTYVERRNVITIVQRYAKSTVFTAWLLHTPAGFYLTLISGYWI